MNKPAALTIEQLTVNYDKTPVLWDISLEIPQRHLIAIIGPNGAGKSTLLKTAMGLIPAVSGKITFFNRPLEEVRLRVAYVPQRESVDWEFPITVLELVLMGRYGKRGILRWLTKSDREAAKRCLAAVDMLEYSTRQISQLSGGQQQRVFLARALLQEADLYLLDEPFAGIDASTEALLIQQLRQLVMEGKTVMVVHHDFNTLQSYFDWVVVLNMRLVTAGPAAACLTRETLRRAYGENPPLLDEAARLSQGKLYGWE